MIQFSDHRLSLVSVGVRCEEEHGLVMGEGSWSSTSLVWCNRPHKDRERLAPRNDDTRDGERRRYQQRPGLCQTKQYFRDVHTHALVRLLFSQFYLRPEILFETFEISLWTFFDQFSHVWHHLFHTQMTFLDQTGTVDLGTHSCALVHGNPFDNC